MSQFYKYRTVTKNAMTGALIGDVLSGGYSPQDPSSSRIKSDTPDFASKRASGIILPVNVYERSDASSSYGDAFIDWSSRARPKTWAWTPYNYDVTGYYLVNAVPSNLALRSFYTSDKATADNTCRAKLSSKLRDVQWDFPVFMGEFNHVLKMFATNVNAGTKYIRNFQSSNRQLLAQAKVMLQRNENTNQARKLRRKMHDTLVNKYLEFTYGWTPLAKDIESAYELVVKTLDPEQLHLKKASHEYFTKLHQYDKTSFTLSGAKVSYNKVGRYRYDVWYGGILEDPEAFGTLPQRMGGNIENFPLIAWELTRFSFLFDYVSNMQQFIGNLTLQWLKLKPGSLYKSYKISYESTINDVTIDGVSDVNTARSITKRSVSIRPANSFIFRRDPITWPELLVRFELEPPSWRQVLNAYALLHATIEPSRKWKVF